MQMNLRTALAAIMVLVLGFTLLAVAIRWIRRTHPGYGRWSIAGLLLVSSALFLSMRSAPSWINTVSANAGIAMGAILYLEGAREFRGLAPRRWPPYAGGVVAIGALTFFCYIVPNRNAQAVVMSTFLGIILALVSATLLREIPTVHRFGQTLTGSMFALCAVTLLVRACYCYVGPPMSDRNAYSGLYGIFFMATVAEMAGFSTGLALLADERMTSDLRDVRERVSRADEQVARHVEAEAALRESEERFRNLADRLEQSEARLKEAQRLARVGSWERPLDPLGTPYWSEEMMRIVGLPKGSPEDFETFLSYVHPQDREKFLEAVRQVQLTRTPIDLEYRLIRPDGEVRFVRSLAEGIKDTKGVVSRIVGATQDITEQVKARKTLRESEERFRRVFEEGPLGMALQGPDHRFLKVNSALCRMVGYSEAALLQMSFIDITHPDDVQGEIELAERLFKLEIPFYRVQKRYVHKGGDIIWVNMTKSIIADTTGESLYGLIMVEDITEIKRTQDEALARQKLESVGTLASGIAHDFNNLLGGVLAQAELGLSELAAKNNPEEELKAIREVAIRGSEIVRQLMIYAGKESELVESVDLSKIVEEMLALLRVSVSKHAVMDAELGQDLPVIRASAAQIRQIVMNLITNASDAIGDRDGVIRVITRRVAQGAESVRDSESSPEGDYLALEVSDTGCGMSRETHERLFDPFFTTKSAGRGLGLAVVSGIVRSLGGSIHVTSEPGKGSTFQILLPCAETRVATTSHAMPSIEGLLGPSQPAVLIVEDEEVLRQAVAKTLCKNGFEVFEAADGSSAIDILRAAPDKIDLILLDMTIPGASSTEVVAEAARTRSDIRVVLTSAYGQEALTAPLNSSQVRGFIRKPFQIGDLVNTLRRAASA
jgi:PAS domain S-box-containing protein